MTGSSSGKARAKNAARDNSGKRQASSSPGIESQPALLRAAFARSPVGMAFIDNRCIIRAANEAFARQVGVSLETVVGYEGGGEIPAWLEAIQYIYQRVCDSGQPLSAEDHPIVFQEHPVSGVTYWDYSISPVEGPGGEALGYLLLLSDVTKRKQAEDEQERLEARLREESQRLRLALLEAQENAERARMSLEKAESFGKDVAQMKALLESMSEGLIVLDSTGRLLVWNQAAREMTGLTDQQAQGLVELPQVAVLGLDGSPLPVEEWPNNRVRTGERVTDQEVIFLRPDGSQRYIVSSGCAVLDDDGKVALAILVFRDVTELRQLEQLRREYVSIISHDLRNPLTVILAHADYLASSPGKARLKSHERRSASFILTSALRINAMIQDLLDSARLDSGQLRLERQPVDLGLLATELVGRQSPLAGWQRVRFELPGDLPLVEADRDRLERILINLISNALKYSPPNSEVLVGAKVAGGNVVVSVFDQGLGIMPEDLPHIFDRFYSAKNPHKVGGLGLGLHITRMLVEAHGGCIWVESVVGRGARFYFNLPVA